MLGFVIPILFFLDFVRFSHINMYILYIVAIASLRFTRPSKSSLGRGSWAPGWVSCSKFVSEKDQFSVLKFDEV